MEIRKTIVLGDQTLSTIATISSIDVGYSVRLIQPANEKDPVLEFWLSGAEMNRLVEELKELGIFSDIATHS